MKQVLDHGLRLHEHAQKEIRVYAKAMLELVEPIVPLCRGRIQGMS